MYVCSRPNLASSHVTNPQGRAVQTGSCDLLKLVGGVSGSTVRRRDIQSTPANWSHSKDLVPVSGTRLGHPPTHTTVLQTKEENLDSGTCIHHVPTTVWCS